MADTDDDEERKVFVTVGTTRFDALVQAVDAPEFKAALRERGFSSLLIQLGRGSYLPSSSNRGGGGPSSASLPVAFFKFAPDIGEHIRSASLVISHAGSGSIFETLRAGTPLVVVVNEALMDNHQSELAQELADRKHLVCAKPETLLEAVRAMDVDALLPYPPSSPTAMVAAVDRFLGYP